MRDTTTIATDISGSGKVLTSEARQLAHAHLNSLQEIEALKREIAALVGGEKVKLSGSALVGKTLYVHSHKKRNGHHSPAIRLISQISSLLRKLGAVTLHSGNRNTVEGAANSVETFFQLNDLITQAIQEAYDAGFDDGNALLMGLASGDLSINDFNAHL